MVNACWAALGQLVAENRRIIVMGSDSMQIKDGFPPENRGQYIEMGIAESNLVGAAAGAAACELIPYVYAVAPFLVYRANEFIRDDICLQKRNVKIIGYSAGMDYCTSGPTHHTTEDLAILRAFPNLTVLSPASVKEAGEMVKAAAKVEGPVYIRLNREKGREVHASDYHFEMGKAEALHDGDDVAVITTGSIVYDVLQAARRAEEKGINARVLHMGTVKPLDAGSILKAAKETGRIITVEEHSITGGIGSAVAEVIAESGINARLVRIGLKDVFAEGYGNHDEIKKMNGMGTGDILDAIYSYSRRKDGEDSCNGGRG